MTPEERDRAEREAQALELEAQALELEHQDGQGWPEGSVLNNPPRADESGHVEGAYSPVDAITDIASMGTAYSGAKILEGLAETPIKRAIGRVVGGVVGAEAPNQLLERTGERPDTGISGVTTRGLMNAAVPVAAEIPQATRGAWKAFRPSVADEVRATAHLDEALPGYIGAQRGNSVVTGETSRQMGAASKTFYDKVDLGAIKPYAVNGLSPLGQVAKQLEDIEAQAAMKRSEYLMDLDTRADFKVAYNDKAVNAMKYKDVSDGTINSNTIYDNAEKLLKDKLGYLKKGSVSAIEAQQAISELDSKIAEYGAYDDNVVAKLQTTPSGISGGQAEQLGGLQKARAIIQEQLYHSANAIDPKIGAGLMETNQLIGHAKELKVPFQQQASAARQSLAPQNAGSLNANVNPSSLTSAKGMVDAAANVRGEGARMRAGRVNENMAMDKIRMAKQFRDNPDSIPQQRSWEPVNAFAAVGPAVRIANGLMSTPPPPPVDLPRNTDAIMSLPPEQVAKSIVGKLTPITGQPMAIATGMNTTQALMDPSLPIEGKKIVLKQLANQFPEIFSQTPEGYTSVMDGKFDSMNPNAPFEQSQHLAAGLKAYDGDHGQEMDFVLGVLRDKKYEPVSSGAPTQSYSNTSGYQQQPQASPLGLDELSNAFSVDGSTSESSSMSHQNNSQSMVDQMDSAMMSREPA